jgi:hypothetical protein
MKKTLMVRFANESVYYTRIDVDVKKIKNPMVFSQEVFFDVDDIRVAIKKEDWDEIKDKILIEK